MCFDEVWYKFLLACYRFSHYFSSYQISLSEQIKLTTHHSISVWKSTFPNNQNNNQTWLFLLFNKKSVEQEIKTNCIRILEHKTGIDLTVSSILKKPSKNYTCFILRRFGLFLIHLQSKIKFDASCRLAVLICKIFFCILRL